MSESIINLLSPFDTSELIGELEKRVVEDYEQNFQAYCDLAHSIDVEGMAGHDERTGRGFGGDHAS